MEYKINNHGVKIMGDAYSTYHGKVRDPYVMTNADVSVSNHVPMNSVSAGHPIIGKPERSVKEARRQMKIAAGIIPKEELTKEENGPTLVKRERKYK